jgi:predicted secreted protein
MALHGKFCKVNIGGYIAELKNWSIDPDCNTPNVTTGDSGGWDEFLSGIKSWAGSFDSLACIDLLGSQIVGTFFTSGTVPSATAPAYVGTVIVKGPKAAVDVSADVKYAYPFQGTGPLQIKFAP